MNKTLFRDARKNLDAVYDILSKGDINIISDLSGKELQAYFYVMDLCQAIYELETEKQDV